TFFSSSKSRHTRWPRDWSSDVCSSDLWSPDLVLAPIPLPDRRRRVMTFYDETETIGKRYRRQDEIGTPWCVTVDGQSLEDGTVKIGRASCRGRGRGGGERGECDGRGLG